MVLESKIEKLEGEWHHHRQVVTCVVLAGLQCTLKLLGLLMCLFSCRLSHLGQRGERPNQQHFSTDSARPQRHLKPRPSLPPEWWEIDPRPPSLPIPPFLNLLSHSFTQTFAEVTFRLLLHFPPPVWPCPHPHPRPSSPSDGATPAVLQAGRGGAARRDSLTDWQPFPRPPLTDD